MAASDSAFGGSIPGLYDRFLGPLLFEPYAAEVARRARSLGARKVLETAAGTGIVTSALRDALPDVEIVATDLNPAMLQVAAEKLSGADVRLQPADALDLPFDDGGFDLLVCQFGVMFFPDKVRGNAEARRVLRDGGRYLAVIWDRIERNPASRLASDAVAALFPDNPPRFLERTPFGYADPGRVEADMRAAGFSDVTLETIALESHPVSARDAATGLVAGCPLASEVEEREPGGVPRAVAAAEQALRSLERDGELDSTLSALLVTAVK